MSVKFPLPLPFLRTQEAAVGAARLGQHLDQFARRG
jgi:hypothetical protein